MGLTVDQPKPGFSSSNDGNTARRFFQNSSKSCKITGVDINMINRFHVILQVISSSHDINVHKFKKYTLDTARLLVKL